MSTAMAVRAAVMLRSGRKLRRAYVEASQPKLRQGARKAEMAKRGKA